MPAGVSAVIPTRNRPEMVVAAAESALAQTHGLLEVIVVVDGPDPPTVAALEDLHTRTGDNRLRILALAESHGGAEARNLGVREARGAWVAFLDDDDLWLPQKLSRQLDAAERSTAIYPVIASAVLARGPGFEAVWPRRLYQAGEPISEYLFCREGWTYGAALLQTSTLFASRHLLLQVPFTGGLKKHQDWDWLLRVWGEPGVQVCQLPEPLAIFHVEGNRTSVGRLPDWQFSIRWAKERRALFTPRAFSAFVATECAPQMARAGATIRQKISLLCIAVLQGSPTCKLLLLCLGFLLIPQSMRRGIRDLVRSVHPENAPAIPLAPTAGRG